MSSSNKKNKAGTSLNYDIPEFVNVDSIRREEFLSQIGNFASEHRKIFQFLCEHWKPSIDYSKFVNKNSSIGFLEKDLVNLLSRLKTAKCGLLKHKCIDGDLQKDMIILTATENKSFYYHLIENEIEISKLSSVHPMFTEEKLEDQKIELPDSYLETIPLENVGRKFLKECKNDERIFKIPITENYAFMTTSGSLNILIAMSVKRIREVLKNTTVLSYVAKLHATAIMDIKRYIGTNDPPFWKKLTVSILDSKEEILQKSRSITDDFFASCELLKNFSENEIRESELKRADEKEMLEEMKTITHEIAHVPDLYIDQSSLNKMLEKPNEKWAHFKDKFYENYVTSKKQTQLPQIVHIGKSYVHRDNIYTYFVGNLHDHAADLLIEYQKLMESLLRTNNSSNISVFFSNENFRNNIREKLAKWDPLMLAFLDRPVIISEAIIHTAKKKLKIREIARIRKLLETYFEPGKLIFRPLEHLFQLDILDIFQFAFLKMPLWKQLFIRILGRYESYRKSFTGMSKTIKAKTYADIQGGSSYEENIPDYSNMSKEERRKEYRNRQDQNNMRMRKPRRSDQEKVTKRKFYSKDEQNEAWSDFSTSFSKKKKIEKTGNSKDN